MENRGEETTQQQFYKERMKEINNLGSVRQDAGHEIGSQDRQITQLGFFGGQNVCDDSLTALRR